MGRAITVSVVAPKLLESYVERLRDPRPAYEAAVVAIRGLVDEEFEKGAERTTAGGFRVWPALAAHQPGKGGGKFSAGGPSRLQKTGALRRAWQGGRGGIKQVTHRGLVVGIDSGILPYAPVLRGPGGPAKIRVTRAMVTQLRAVYGVRVKRSTKFFSIPRRPHALPTPDIRQAAELALRSHILGEAAA